MQSRVLDVRPHSAAILYEAYRKILSLASTDHYRMYDLVRNVMAGITTVDAFYVGLFHGQTRIHLPYCYDEEKYDAPETHTFAPNGPTAWVHRHLRTYRYELDGGRVVRAGLSFGDVRKVSADVVTVPMFRSADDRREIFGVVSMHSYRPKAYGVEAVAAFEWIARVLASALNRDWEDERIVALLPGGQEDLSPLSVERVVEYVVGRLDVFRQRLDEAGALVEGDLPSRTLDELGHECGSLQTDLTEMLLQTDDEPSRRFHSLTDREQAVAKLLADGIANPEIAARLSVSVETVKSHLARIREKYAMTERLQIADDVGKHLRSIPTAEP
jgi:DNA-binding CsgD family transcriptional regulator